MKPNKLVLIMLTAFAVQFFTACSHKTTITIPKGTSNGNTKSMPPGQAKKASGSQSAKPHAPGQQKKKQ